VHDSPGEPVTALPADPGHAVLRIASVNLESGGLSETGDDVRWRKSVAALLAQDPHVVLCQEMTAPSAFRLQAHLWRTANELGMTPVLGPPAPASFSSNHTAVLVRTSAGLAILDTGPPAGPQPGSPAAWCQALVQVPGISYPVCFYSVHLPARSAVEQLSQAQRLASRIAQDGALAVAGGDWNCYAPADALTPRKRWPRCRRTCGHPACASPPASWRRTTTSTTPRPSPGSPTPRRSCRPAPATPGNWHRPGSTAAAGLTASTSPSRSPGPRAATSSATPAAATTRRCC
jgi:hypothetical protein